MRDVIREIQGWLEGEIRVVPPGLRVGMRVYPALKRWAKFGRASGTGTLWSVSFVAVFKFLLLIQLILFFIHF